MQIRSVQLKLKWTCVSGFSSLSSCWGGNPIALQAYIKDFQVLGTSSVMNLFWLTSIMGDNIVQTIYLTALTFTWNSFFVCIVWSHLKKKWWWPKKWLKDYICVLISGWQQNIIQLTQIHFKTVFITFVVFNISDTSYTIFIIIFYDYYSREKCGRLRFFQAFVFW